MDVRPLDVAQHEAAHVVVGLALGLRLRRAVVGAWPGDASTLGYAWFRECDAPRGRGQALALMYAAGVAWDRALRYPQHSHAGDLALLRPLVRGCRDVETCVTAAAAILAGRMVAHARVTRALLEGDVTARDVLRMTYGV